MSIIMAQFVDHPFSWLLKQLIDLIVNMKQDISCVGGTGVTHVSFISESGEQFLLRLGVRLKLPCSHLRTLFRDLSESTILGFLQTLRFLPFDNTGPIRNGPYGT